ncbi:unnamed protein product, partial [Urochloa humidicola]
LESTRLSTQQYITPVNLSYQWRLQRTAAVTRSRSSLPSMLTKHTAHALLSSGHGYIDVRMREDFDKGHTPGARNVPYYLSVTPQGKEKNPHFEDEVATLYGKDDVFIVGCNTGNRSRFATADLLNAGFKNARNLQGGYRSFLQSANQQPAQQH